MLTPLPLPYPTAKDRADLLDAIYKNAIRDAIEMRPPVSSHHFGRMADIKAGFRGLKNKNNQEEKVKPFPERALMDWKPGGLVQW